MVSANLLQVKINFKKRKKKKYYFIKFYLLKNLNMIINWFFFGIKKNLDYIKIFIFEVLIIIFINCF
jgi:predicted transcriptional regulator